MARYAYLFETTLLADGSAILPVTEENGEIYISLKVMTPLTSDWNRRQSRLEGHRRDD